MPLAALRICAGNGCTNLVVCGFCASCQSTRPASERDLDHGAHTFSTSARGYDRAWKRARARFLSARCRPCADLLTPLSICSECRGSGLANAFCAECLAGDRFVAATQVDHVIRFQERPELRLDPRNFQGICDRHSSLKTVAETHGATFALSEFQVKQRERVEMLIAGEKLGVGRVGVEADAEINAAGSETAADQADQAAQTVAKTSAAMTEMTA